MSRRLVLDASAAIAAVLLGSGGNETRDLLERAELVLAPDLLALEAANALWKYAKRGDIDADGAVTALERVLSLVDSFVPDGELAKEALVASVAAGHPIYDMTYAVLARREGATVVTADRRFASILSDMAVPAHLVATPSR